jgi:hypothetical protein
MILLISFLDESDLDESEIANQLPHRDILLKTECRKGNFRGRNYN